MKSSLLKFELPFRTATQACALFVLFTISALILSLFIASWPAFHAFGFGFLTTAVWNPVRDVFGALAPMTGTVETSLIALLFSVPFAFGIAFTLTEIAPTSLRRPVGIAIELLAAIPSIIFGMWGLFVLAPFLQHHIQPALIDALSPIPLIGALFEGPPYGIGILTAGFILGVMILPYIAAYMRDVFLTVPEVLKESAYAMGATKWDIMRHIVLPYSSVGVLGGIILGLGRALGETMAVTFVVGNAHRIKASLFAPGTTISASIANEFNEAVGDLYISSLIALGFILFVITFIVLAIGKALLRRIQEKEGVR